MYVPPSGFTIAGRFIAYYGITMTIAIFSAYFIISAMAHRRGISKKDVFIFAAVCAPIGIVGARFMHVIMNLNENLSFIDIIAFWRGWQGLSIYGGMAFGLAAIAMMCYIKKLNFLKVADIAAPGFILGQAIGRWGNFFNQELYGPVVKFKVFPFSTLIEADGMWHASLFFYEFLTNTAGFFLLWYLLRKTKRPGTVAASWLIYYGAVRAILEPFRDGSYNVAWIIISAISIATGIAILTYFYFQNKKRKAESV